MALRHAVHVHQFSLKPLLWVGVFSSLFTRIIDPFDGRQPMKFSNSQELIFMKKKTVLILVTKTSHAPEKYWLSRKKSSLNNSRIIQNYPMIKFNEKQTNRERPKAAPCSRFKKETFWICKRTLLLKFHHITVPKTTRWDTQKTRKPHFSLLETAKNPSCTTENLSKNEKLRKTTFFRIFFECLRKPQGDL